MSDGNSDPDKTDKRTFLSTLSSLKAWAVAIITLGTLALVVIRFWGTLEDHRNFEARYPKLAEELLLYSVVGQVSGDQQEVVVSASNREGYGGGNFTLRCGHDFFNGETRALIGGVFSCWDQEALAELDMFDQLSEEQMMDQPISGVTRPTVYNNGDTFHQFSLYTIFGKSASVEVNHTSELAEKLEKDFCQLAEGYAAAEQVACGARMYAINVSYGDETTGITRIGFVLVPVVPTQNAAGDVVLRREWQIFPEEDANGSLSGISPGTPISELTSQVRQSLQSIETYEADITNVGAEIERRWKNRDRHFFDQLDANLKALRSELK